MLRRDFAEHGFTDSCAGCYAAGCNLQAKHHTEACRDRTMEELRRTEDGQRRIKEAVDRMFGHCDRQGRAEAQAPRERRRSADRGRTIGLLRLGRRLRRGGLGDLDGPDFGQDEWTSLLREWHALATDRRAPQAPDLDRGIWLVKGARSS